MGFIYKNSSPYGVGKPFNAELLAACVAKELHKTKRGGIAGHFKQTGGVYSFYPAEEKSYLGLTT